MGLEAINGVGPATVKKLNKAGVRTLDDVRKMDIQHIAAKTGLAAERLGEWQALAKQVRVIEDVPGIGPATIKKLKTAGVADLARFVDADAQTLAKKTGVAASRITTWQAEAKKLTATKTTTKKAPARAAAVKTAKTTKTPAKGAVRPTKPQAEPSITPTGTPETAPEAALALDTVRAPSQDEPRLVTDGTHEYHNGHNGNGSAIDESQGFFRKVMTFLTGGPMR